MAQSDIMMWRAFVLLLIANPAKLSRPIESFRPRDAQYCIKYDASLTGLGVGIYNVLTDTLLTYTALELPFQVTNESERQNTMEFVAVIFGLLLAWKLKLQNFSYTLHGDNMSSLAWAKADRVNSTLARRANIVFTTVSMHINASLSDTQHIPGIMNVLFDGLSRHVSPTKLGLDPTLMFNAANDVSILRYVTQRLNYQTLHHIMTCYINAQCCC